MYYEWEKHRESVQAEEKRRYPFDPGSYCGDSSFLLCSVNLFHIYTEYKKGTDEYNHIEQMAVTDRAPDSQEVAGPNAQPKARSTWILQHLRA